MDSVLLQAESHENGFDSEHAFELGDDRNTTSSSCSDRSFAKREFEAVFGSLVGRQIQRAKVSLAAMHRRDFDTYAGWCDGLHIVGKRPADGLMILIGNKPAGNFGKRLGGQNGF